MRIVFFGNNETAANVLRWLVERGDEIVGLVVHPRGRARNTAEILASIPPNACPVFEGPELKSPKTIAALKTLRPEMGISIGFGYILSKEILGLFPRGCVNLHAGFLPFNRGAYPNVWSLVEGTPAGVTLHFMDEGVDTGDIIARRRLAKRPCDTGESLYRRLEIEGFRLFRESWARLRKTNPPVRGVRQKGPGTVHRVADIEQIDGINLGQTYKAKDLLNLLRARTFPPYPGAYFRHKGRKIYLRLQLLEESELGGRATDGKVH